MKNVLVSVSVALCALFVNVPSFAAETKTVCHKEVKKGKEVEVCKKIKVHKKLEGTKIPEKKK